MPCSLLCFSLLLPLARFWVFISRGVVNIPFLRMLADWRGLYLCLKSLVAGVRLEELSWGRACSAFNLHGMLKRKAKLSTWSCSQAVKTAQLQETSGLQLSCEQGRVWGMLCLAGEP